MPAKSEKQRRWFALLYAIKTGKYKKKPSKKAEQAAKNVSLETAKEFMRKA